MWRTLELSSLPPASVQKKKSAERGLSSFQRRRISAVASSIQTTRSFPPLPTLTRIS